RPRRQQQNPPNPFGWGWRCWEEARFRATVARGAKFCQTHDRMRVPSPYTRPADAREGPMIRYLAIRNLAVIESVAVDFEPAFNILTGETGAGKSILVEAVGLLLGGRATQDLLRSGEDLATVEAIFEDEDGRE